MTSRLSHAHRIAATLTLLLVATSACAHATKPEAFKTRADFDQCLRGHYAQDECLRSLESYVKAHPGEAMDAGKQVRRNFHSHVALPFFEIAQKQSVKGFCSDEDVQLAVVSGLSLPADYVNAEHARKLLTGPCFAAHEAAVLAELKNEKGESYLKNNACPILKQQGRTPAACEPVVAPPAAAEEHLPAVDKATLQLGIIKTYTGPEGERVTLAPIDGSDLYLVHFEGIAGPWNGKSVLHKREELGNGKANFWTEHEGARWVGIVQRGGMAVFAPGNRQNNGFHVGYSEKATQLVDTKAVLGAF